MENSFSDEDLAKIHTEFDSIKNQVTLELDEIKELILQKAMSVKSKGPFHYNSSAVQKTKSNIIHQLQSLKKTITKPPSSIEPSLIERVNLKTNIGFNYGACRFDQMRGIILAAPSDMTLNFIDIDTLKPHPSYVSETLQSSIIENDYCEETDTQIYGCSSGHIYTYDLNQKSLQLLIKGNSSFVLAIKFLNSDIFFFSYSKTASIQMGSVSRKKIITNTPSNHGDVWSLYIDKEHQLLLAGLDSGKIQFYETVGGVLSLLQIEQCQQKGKYVTGITGFKFAEVQHYASGGNGEVINIWTLKDDMSISKKMTIKPGYQISMILYLPYYKILACSHHNQFLSFYDTQEGKLVSKYQSDKLKKIRNIFPIRSDKLACADLNVSEFEILSL